MLGASSSSHDLGRKLARDPQGIALRDLRARLIAGRARLVQTRPQGSEIALRAYDAALAALPELWRQQQRSI